MPCHADNIASYSEAECVSEGLVVPKEPYQSKLFKRLKGSNAGGGSEDMPQYGPALSGSEIQIIRNWIEGMDTATPLPSPSATPSTPFGRVQAILQTSCVTCHKDFGKYKEIDFISKGYVVAGSASRSELYANLIGSGETTDDGTPPDMPKKGNPLTAGQLQEIRNWIDEMTPPTSPSPSPSPTPLPLFGQAKAIMSVSCVTCHKTFGTYAEADFVSKGYIVAGSASQSELYARLIGSGEVTEDGTPPDMPKKGNPLTAAQLQVIQAWINGLTPLATPSPSPSPQND